MTTDIAKLIIEIGFFGKELPSDFSSSTLSSKVSSIDLSNAVLPQNINKKWTKLIHFSVPNNKYHRRTLSIVHPLHFIKLANVIEENWIRLQSHYNKSSISLTKPKLIDGKLKTLIDFNQRNNIRIKNLAFNKYVLSIDINRYYPSIYTHSIAWALHTKEFSKINMRDANLLGNKIDLEIRNMQDGQTMGVPIGPITSSFVQEIIATSIDFEFSEAMGRDVPGVRYTDDMEYYFSSKEEATRALSVMMSILRNYNLDINVEKTKIKESPIEFNSSWVYELNRFKFRVGRSNSDLIQLERRDLDFLFNKIFKLMVDEQEKGVAKYALSVLKSRQIYCENWSIFQSLILQLAFIDAGVLPMVFDIIEAYQIKGFNIDYAELQNFAISLVEENIKTNNDFEIIWILNFMNRMRMSLSIELTEKLCVYDNTVVSILILLLNENNLLNNFSNFSALENRIVNEDLYDENWLLLYESCRRGWLNKDDSILNQDQFFKQLHQNDITFISNEGSSSEVEVINNLVDDCLKKIEIDFSQNREEILNMIIEEKGWTILDAFKLKILSKLEIKIEMIDNAREASETENETTDEDVAVSVVETENREEAAALVENQEPWIIKLLNASRDKKYIEHISEEDY